MPHKKPLVIKNDDGELLHSKPNVYKGVVGLRLTLTAHFRIIDCLAGMDGQITIDNNGNILDVLVAGFSLEDFPDGCEIEALASNGVVYVQGMG